MPSSGTSSVTDPQDTYDVALVLGSGIREDGSIPESAQLRTAMAVELYQAGTVKHVIFSGKWSYRYVYTPPTTEAAAMAVYARSLGLPEAAITVEAESNTTISNFCLCKRILRKRGWTRALFIINRPYAERAFLYMRKVFEPDIAFAYVLTHFRFAPDKEANLEQIEAEKIKSAKTFLANLPDGDEEAILAAATRDLEEHAGK